MMKSIFGYNEKKINKKKKPENVIKKLSEQVLILVFGKFNIIALNFQVRKRLPYACAVLFVCLVFTSYLRKQIEKKN